MLKSMDYELKWLLHNAEPEKKGITTMELRVLEYFLAIAREESILGAAQSLHLSQPTLSRQIRELEEEYGTQLLIRGKRKITLTEEGMILRRRAQEILDLVQKTEGEITASSETVTGDVYIGAGETEAMRLIAQTAHQLQTVHPGIHFHLSSGDSMDLKEQLDKGLIDFALIFCDADTSKHHVLQLPTHDNWGALMRKDNPLAPKGYVTPEDLADQPLILSRQMRSNRSFTRWIGREDDELNVVATYNLLYNASILVEEGLGCALGLNRIINTSGNSSLVFLPFFPALKGCTNIIWKKYQIFSKAAQCFLDTLENRLEEENRSCTID